LHLVLKEANGDRTELLPWVARLSFGRFTACLVCRLRSLQEWWDGPRTRSERFLRNSLFQAGEPNYSKRLLAFRSSS